MLAIRLSIILSLIFILNIEGRSMHFGKFKVKLISIDKCKGPKRKECCKMDWNIENINAVHYTVDVPKNVAPLRAKITVATNGKDMVRLQMNKVCDNFFMKPLMKTTLNVTNDCVIKKGGYKLNIDMEKLMQNYYGGEFFYGNLTVKTLLNNNECNFLCSNLKAVFLPKD